MRTRSHRFLYEAGFVDGVQRGTKPHTIRARRRNGVRVGDTLVHCRWSGKPYRPGSKQLEFRRDVCTSVKPVEINAGNRCVYLNLDNRERALLPAEIEAMAKRDGFANAEAFFAYFKTKDGGPWHGDLIAWA